MGRFVLATGTIVAVLAFIPSLARAEDRTYWEGEEPDGRQWHFKHSAGDDWYGNWKIPGGLFGTTKRGNLRYYTEVKRTADYIDLQDNKRPEVILRLYKDKADKWEDGVWDKFMKKGEWTSPPS